MVTDLDLAQVCWDLYYDTAKIDSLINASGVVVGIKHLPDASVICFRGSSTIIDWVRDFQAQMLYDSELGGVECGFIQGLRDIIGTRPGNLLPVKPLYITGHSLGAARALLFAALEKLRGLPIAGITVFGPPRPGGIKVKEILAPLPVKLYRNRQDPVCDVPLELPVIDPYMHVRELTAVDVAPAPDDPWGVVADHHMTLYLQAMKNALAFTNPAA